MTKEVNEMTVAEVIDGLGNYGWKVTQVEGGFVLRSKGMVIGSFTPASEKEIRRHLRVSMRDEAAIKEQIANGGGCVVLGGILSDLD